MPPSLKYLCLLIVVLTIFHPVLGGIDPVVANFSLAPDDPDAFIYTVSDTEAYNWLDASGGQDVGFASDDAYSGPVPIGFDFNFYENSYTELYISTNGLITFGNGSSKYINHPVPKIEPPNNFIAPFWDDLAVGGDYNNGKVYYDSGNLAGVNYFLVEWHEISIKDSSDSLTFEAILYENGNICFQYHTLEGVIETETVGIEDADGIDGAQYLFDESGLKDLEKNNAVCFFRPGSEARVKATPLYQSQFVQNRQAEFNLTIHNTGEEGADVYDLTTVTAGSNWDVTYYRAAGNTPLTDSNHNGWLDSGVVEQGQEFEVRVLVQTPTNPQAGEFTRLELQFQSANNPVNTAEATLQAAVPAPFTQAYTDSQSGMHLKRFNRDWQETHLVIGDFTGSTMTVMATRSGYVYAWERNGFNGQVFYSDIEYILVNPFGDIVRPLTKLTSNSTQNDYTVDHFPSMAVLPDGKIGMLWVRNIINASLEMNSNLFLAILDPGGNLIHGPQNVTQNNGWRGFSNLEVPEYVTPHLLATGDNRFALTWASDYLAPAGEASDIYYAIYDRSGSVIKNPTVFALSTPGSERYLAPSLTQQGDDRMVLAYSIFNPAAVTNTLAYGILDSQGNVLRGETSISGSEGRNVDGVQLLSGNVLLAWTGVTSNRIHYALINGSNYTVQSGPETLVSPYDRIAENVSVTNDQQGNAILTWMDAELNDYLYYALVAPNGSLRTPPMIFQTGLANEPQILTSYAGEGNTTFVPGMVFLPHVTKQH